MPLGTCDYGREQMRCTKKLEYSQAKGALLRGDGPEVMVLTQQPRGNWQSTDSDMVTQQVLQTISS